MYALCRQLLLQRLPDVHAGLLSAGVAEAPLAAQMPPTLTDRDPRSGDEQLTALMTRRVTFDGVLRQVAATQPGLTVRAGVHVTGLLAVPGGLPRVVGVRTDRGKLAADLVVAPPGRGSASAHGLPSIAPPATPPEGPECGRAYYSRH